MPANKVDLNLCLGGQGTSIQPQGKRPKLASFTLDCDSLFPTASSLESRPISVTERMPNSSGHYVCSISDDDGSLFISDSTRMEVDENVSPEMDDQEIRMDLTDDLLHLVLSFLDHDNLCRAAKICRQWRVASAHEDFWRNLELLTLEKGQLGETFFQALTDCATLKSLIVTDAILGNGIQEIPIIHDSLRHIQIVKCRVVHVYLRCSQLQALSLKRSSMTHAGLNCPLLRDLDIASCHKLLEVAIRSAVMVCPLLESLDMSNCSCVGGETLRKISLTCGNLHSLNASYCPNISLEPQVLELDNCSLLTSFWSFLAYKISDLYTVANLWT